MTAVYVENDRFAAAWLRELIKTDAIAFGDVMERSIEDVRPDELTGYAQVHLYAGIGVWSYALRLAGWPDDRPVWTFSEPCQPFSAAGKRAGTADERYLRPATHHLVSQCKPDVCFGEQVASKDGLGWLDTLQADMEGEGYAGGAVDLCAAGVGAPHIRQRLFFAFERMDDAASARHERTQRGTESDPRDETRMRMPSEGCAASGMADANNGNTRIPRNTRTAESAGCKYGFDIDNGGDAGGMADAECEQWNGGRSVKACDESRSQQRAERFRDAFEGEPAGSPTDGFWQSADWLLCRDGKWRPVEPGTFPLAHAAAARVGRLRGYGNAINAEVAATFIEAYFEVKGRDDRYIPTPWRAA